MQVGGKDPAGHDARGGLGKSLEQRRQGWGKRGKIVWAEAWVLFSVSGFTEVPKRTRVREKTVTGPTRHMESAQPFGNLATCGESYLLHRPMALRPRLTTGLPFRG